MKNLTEQCDVIILGTGAAGLTAGLAAAHEGASVRIFEKSELRWNDCMMAELFDSKQPFARGIGVKDPERKHYRTLSHFHWVNRFRYGCNFC